MPFEIRHTHCVRTVTTSAARPTSIVVVVVAAAATRMLLLLHFETRARSQRRL